MANHAQFDVLALHDVAAHLRGQYEALYPGQPHRQSIAHAIDSGHFDDWEKDEPPPYWWLTKEQVEEITEAAVSVLADEAEEDCREDHIGFFLKHAEYRMAGMGIVDLVDRVKDVDDALTFDPEQQPGSEDTPAT